MRIPPIDTVEGAYWYFIALLAIVVILIALYIGGMVAGLAPDFTQLF